jgi:hypothetical protein
MGRILFLSTVAFLAYRYIARSNQRHQSLPAGEKKGVEILPPVPATASVSSPSTPALTGAAAESGLQSKLIATPSRAAEADPVR